MRRLVLYIRQCFCKHEFERKEVIGELTGGMKSMINAPIVILICNKCGYHRSFWKFNP